MSPRVGPLEIPAAKGKDPRREDTNPPPVEFDPIEKSTKAQVAEFRTARYTVSMPAAVVLAAVTGLSAAVVAWINKPAPGPALTSEQAAALVKCGQVAQDVAEIKTFIRWAEPQIGILIVRTDSRAYTPPPTRTPAPPGWPAQLAKPEP